MRRAAILVVLAAAFLVACNAILGLDPQHVRADAATAADATTPDAAADGIAPDAGGSAYAREVFADRPLLYLRFGESGGATARDEMQAHDGTYPSFGVTFAVPGALAGDPDTAVMLGGQSKITLPAGADFADVAPFSVEIWLQQDPAIGDLAFVIDHQSWEPPGRDGWDVVTGSGGASFERYGDAGDRAVGAPALAPSTWTHMLFTWDGGFERVFVNGNLAGEGNGIIPIDAVPGSFTVGGMNCSCSGNFYTGALDELAIYDHLLTGDRVQAHLRAAGR